MPTTLNAKCACCNVVADGDVKKIEEVFGFCDEKKTAHELCRKCRSKKCSSDHKNC